MACADVKNQLGAVTSEARVFFLRASSYRLKRHVDVIQQELHHSSSLRHEKRCSIKLHEAAVWKNEKYNALCAGSSLKGGKQHFLRVVL